MNKQAEGVGPIQPAKVGGVLENEDTMSVEQPAAPRMLMIGTSEDINTGSVLIKADVELPESVHFELKQYGSWRILPGMTGSAVERGLSEAGWNFFFVVPEIRAGALSSNRNRALRKALKKILNATERQNLNAVEIAEIDRRRFSGMHYVNVVAHPRHVKRSPFLRDLDPYHVARRVWESKLVLKTRAHIPRTSKGI